MRFCKPIPSAGLNTVGEWLDWGKRSLGHLGRAEAAASAEQALGHVTGFERYRLYLDRHKQIAPEQKRLFRSIIRKRSARAPLAYLLKKKSFWKEELEVGPGCLIPRPETEILVETFLKSSGFRKDSSFIFLDLCAGSGAIGVSVLREFPKAFGYFADVSTRALAYVKKNVRNYGLESRCAIVRSALFTAFENKKISFDAILSNPPYVAEREWKQLQPELHHEPALALKGGKDGLDFYRSIVRDAPRFLRDSKQVYFEAGRGQAARVKDLLTQSGFENITVTKDHAGIPRVIAAWHKGIQWIK